MKDLEFQLQAWTLNTVYDRVENCLAIKPTHKTQWLSWDDFMLDKRLWLTSIQSVVGQSFTDDIKIDWRKLYYWKDEISWEWKIFNWWMWELLSKPLRDDSPMKLTKWRWGGWQLILDARETTNSLEPISAVYNPAWYDSNADYKIWDWVTSWGYTYICYKDNSNIPVTNTSYWVIAVTAWYSELLEPFYWQATSWEDNSTWGLIALNIPWHWFTVSTSRYITFTSWILKWITNKILDVSWDTCYIAWTNVHWSLPKDDDKYMIFSEARDVILTGNDEWVTVTSLTDKNDAYEFYYNIIITYWYVNYLVLKIDWTKILLTWADNYENRDLLIAALPTWYIFEVVNWLLFCAKDDWTESVITEADVILRVDLNYLDSRADAYNEYPSLAIDCGWVQVTLHSWDDDPNAWSPYIDREEDSSSSNWNYDDFYKNNFINKIISLLPTWYTWIKISTWLYTSNMWIFSWQGKNIYDFNYTLLIYKDDLTENAVTYVPTYSHELKYSHNNTIWSNTDTVSIELDWITYWPYTVNSTYVRETYQTIYTWLLSEPDIKLTPKIYDWTNDYYGIHHIDGRQLAANITYTWTSPAAHLYTNSEFNYQTDAYYLIIWVDEWSTTWTLVKHNETSIQNSSTNVVNSNLLSAYSYTGLYWDNIDWVQALNIIDIVEFEWSIFVLTDNQIFFSRITFDDNTHFYPLDKLPYKWWIKLIPFGQTLMVMWEINKLITKTTAKFWSTNVTSYVMKGLEFTWSLYSKYSYTYTDGVLYFLQDDKRLMTLSIAPGDSVTYRVQSNEISRQYRYMLEDVKWECHVAQHGKYLNFLFVDWWTTENYQFDISLNHWIVNSYDKPIYKITDEVLTWVTAVDETWYIAREEWYTDFWTIFKQVINFSFWSLIKLTQTSILRTVFWLNKEDRLDVNLTVEREEASWVMNTDTHRLNNYLFDTWLDSAPDGDELIWEETNPMYTGNIASIQTDIYTAGKFTRFRYESENRFIMSNNYLIVRDIKAIINDILTSN